MSKSFLSRHLLNKNELVEGNKVIKNSNDHLQPWLAQQRTCGPRGKKNVIDANSVSAYGIVWIEHILNTFQSLHCAGPKFYYEATKFIRHLCIVH
jgi:hypothetical protein